MDVPHSIQQRLHAATLVALTGTDLLPGLLSQSLRQMPDGLYDHVHTSIEVMLLRPLGDPGPFGNPARRHRCVPLVDQALDRGVQQRRTRRFPALGLSPTLDRGRWVHVIDDNTDTSQSTEMFLG